MVAEEGVMSFDKDDLPELPKTPGGENIPLLVEWLALKNDAVRYRAADGRYLRGISGTLKR
jgi:hypothetical protein